MKRKLLTALLALALLASAYTAYACLATRGMRVYLMGTGLGAVLAGSWQFTLLAAVILWLPCLALAVGKVRGLRKKKAVSSTAETQETGAVSYTHLTLPTMATV